MKRTENETESGAPRRPTPEEYRAARRRVQRETTRVVKRTLIGIALFAGMYYLFLATNARQVAPPTEPETPRATVEVASDANADAENAPSVEAPTTAPAPPPTSETPVENAPSDAPATP